MQFMQREKKRVLKFHRTFVYIFVLRINFFLVCIAKAVNDTKIDVHCVAWFV